MKWLVPEINHLHYAPYAKMWHIPNLYLTSSMVLAFLHLVSAKVLVDCCQVMSKT